MDKIVSDLQAFVRPIRIEKKPIDLKELINSVLFSVSVPANIALKKQLPNNFPEIHADPQLLETGFNQSCDKCYTSHARRRKTNP